MPVSVCVALISAPGTAEPEASSTVPWICAVFCDCAQRLTPPKARKSVKAGATEAFANVYLHLWNETLSGSNDSVKLEKVLVRHRSRVGGFLVKPAEIARDNRVIERVPEIVSGAGVGVRSGQNKLRSTDSRSTSRGVGRRLVQQIPRRAPKVDAGDRVFAGADVRNPRIE